MKDYIAGGKRRLWYEDDEIEQMMETKLSKANLSPSVQSAVVDIERFVEGHLGASLDQYADLDDTVLGETAFGSDGSCEVRISRALTSAVDDEEGCPPGVRGRWRATMAHEAAHIVLHTVLFRESASQGSLFDMSTPPAARQVRRCDPGDVGFAKAGAASDWREVQANKGMAALLMPRSFFCETARAEMLLLPGAPAVVHLASPQHAHLGAQLALRFQVSRQAAMIRLETLKLVGLSTQTRLL